MREQPEDIYHTIQSPAEGFYKEKGSKFIAHAYPVTEEAQIKAQLEALRKQYHDARHHCYAYILGYQQENYRANDDGEPNNSAGNPILGQIRSKNLTNVLVVVVRYFGGTKLGVSGLIQAYKTAAAEALEQAKILEEQIQDRLILRFTYPQMNDVMRLVKEMDLEITQQKMELDCEMQILVRQSLRPEVEARLELLREIKHEWVD